ncbi:MAG: phenylalanine--tRNA ligase subunit alpha [Clostridia bacterium]
MFNEKTQRIISEAQYAVDNAGDSTTLTEIKVKYLGKNGEITALLKSLKDVAPQDKPAAGKKLNETRVFIDSIIEEKANIIKAAERDERIKREALDVTLSTKKPALGALHPLTLVKNDITDIFLGMGFSVKDGPEIEFERYNFTALNIPQDHPSRDATDTFYVTNELLLRTQTSAVQVHVMESEKPPIRIICPGKVYRPDDDATHSPMFQQIEGLVIDENITLSDLKGVLDAFAKAFFSSNTRTRFRPSHFPFTEPSVEVDLSCPVCDGAGCRICKNTGWLELLGAGVVNPAVLEHCGIDSKKYSGFAFGLGVERAAMVKYGIPDMRLLFDNDVRYLKQFR